MTETISAVVTKLIKKHGGIRAAARALDIDAAYLMRMRDGTKNNPSDCTLKKLGIKREYSVLR